MKFFAFLVFLLSSFAYAQQDQRIQKNQWSYYGEEFYQTLASKKFFERSLFNKIFNENHTSAPGKMDGISSQCQSTNCYRHTVVGYDRARKIMFGELDIQKDSQGNFIIDVYCGRKVYFDNVEQVSGMHENINIEHTWPQSRFNGNFAKEMQKSDMHHLYLTDSQANSHRGNNPFGIVPQAFDRNDMTGCSSSGMGFVAGQSTYTPPAQHRGNVARALFYFAMHYNLQIDQTQEKTLRLWHRIDPVDAAEILRHEKIAKHQKVRNPFIDHPEIVDRINDF